MFLLENFRKNTTKEKNITNLSPLFQVQPVFETIPVDSNSVFKFHFMPPLTPDISDEFFEGNGPYEEILNVNVLFSYYKEEFTKALTLHGTILPPAIQFDCTEYLLNQIYIGERHCFTIQISNVGLVPGKVRLKNISSEAYLTVENTEWIVNPEDSENIYVQYFGKIPGAFVDILTFKVGYGSSIDFLIK